MPTESSRADRHGRSSAFRIAAARRILYREGCDSNVGGHVSARAADEDDAFWVTAFEYFDQTTPEPGAASSGSTCSPASGELAFSPAVNFHARIYETRPDVTPSCTCTRTT